MPLNKKTMNNCVDCNRFYVDLRDLQDDTAVLKNPHKGWYYHYVDNGFYCKKYRGENEYEQDRIDAPGINHIYIRFDWRDVEKEKGKYDWSLIDDIIHRFGKNGYKFTFRACTFEGASIDFAVPEWLVKMGINGTWCDFGGKKSFEPDYSDPVFLNHLNDFMKAYGKRYNGHPLVEYIDIGTFGTWGEGHTYGGSMKKFEFNTILKHINMHLKYFPDTLIMMNDDIINHLSLSDPEQASEMYDYCLGRHMGIRDDGVCVRVFCEEYGFSTLRSPGYFDDFSKNAPVDLELEHYSVCKGKNFAGGYRFYEAMKQAHATYAGFHGYLDEWLKDNKDFHNHCANKLGYWYFIEGISVPELVSGTKSDVKVVIKNNGFSKAYHRFDIKIRLCGNNGKFILNSQGPDNRRWQAESLNEEIILLNLYDVPPGEYWMQVGMFEGELPIKMGFAETCKTEDGYYNLFEVNVKQLEI